MPLTTDQVLDELLRHLPPRYEASRAVLAAHAGQIAHVLRVAELDIIQATTIGNAQGPFLTLLARGYGVRRAAGESDASVRSHLQDVDDALTPTAIEDAVNELLSDYTADTCTLIEHWTQRRAVDTTDIPQAAICDTTYLYGHAAFTLVVPDLGDPSHPVYAAIAAQVDRLRAGGVSWRMILEGT